MLTLSRRAAGPRALSCLHVSLVTNCVRTCWKCFVLCGIGDQKYVLIFIVEILESVSKGSCLHSVWFFYFFCYDQPHQLVFTAEGKKVGERVNASFCVRTSLYWCMDIFLHYANKDILSLFGHLVHTIGKPLCGSEVKFNFKLSLISPWVNLCHSQQKKKQSSTIKK